MNYIIEKRGHAEKPCEYAVKCIANCVIPQDKKEPIWVISLSDDKILPFVRKYENIVLKRDDRYIGYDYCIIIGGDI